MENYEKIVLQEKCKLCFGLLHLILELSIKIISIIILILFSTKKENKLFIGLAIFLLIAAKVSCCVTGCNSSNCNVTTGNCSACIPGYYFTASTNGTCTNCSSAITNCNSCSISTKCLSCLSGYYLNTPTNSTCTLCSSAIPNCLICTNSTKCFVCISTLYYVNNSATGNLSCVLCSAGISNCGNCANSTYCSSCNSTLYYLNSVNRSCVACSASITNCLNCINQTSCSSCVSTLYYLSSSLSCVLCSTTIANCRNCINQSYCFNCSNTQYYLVNGNLSCTLCSTGIANCRNCVNLTYCTSCTNTLYYLGNGNLTCVLCSSAITNCQSCTNQTYCSTCITQYYFNIGSISCILCSSAITNCQSCTNQTYCSTCITQYYFNAGTLSCALCSSAIINCLTCSNTTKCSVCISTLYYVNSSATGNMSCVLCSGISNCVYCTNQTYCLSCVSTSYYQSITGITANCALCSSAITNCINCLNKTYCISCLSTSSYLLITGSTASCPLCSTALPSCTDCVNQTYCNACLSVAYLDNPSIGYANCILCSVAISNCSYCIISTVCITCQPTYYQESSSGASLCVLCSSLISNCSNCTSATICIQCVTGYYLWNDGIGNVGCFLCSDAIFNCLNCTNQTFCISCILTYYLELNAIGIQVCSSCSIAIASCNFCINNTYCTSCDSLSYVVNSGIGSTTCALCSTSILYCNSCTNHTYCTDCISSYYAKRTGVGQSICALCWNALSNCLICTNITFVGVSFLSCMSCAANYAPMFGNNTAFYCGVCSVVILGCQYCLTPTSCYSCLNSYYFQSVTHSCTPCFYVFPNCNNCSQSVCIQCLAGFYMKTQTLCSNCSIINGCQLCNNATNCLVCLTKYVKINNYCYLCADIFSNCNKCIVSRCLACKESFYLDSLHHCACLKGNLVGGYCIDIYGCNQTQQYQQTVICTGCSWQFTYDIQFLNCYCTHGNYISDMCTNLTGCISVMHTNSGQICIMCNLTAHFILNNRSCICQQGFYLQNQNIICTEICGDGLVFVLPCDDGNVRDNDGCSSTCQLEKYFTCYGGNSTSRSNCVYSGKQISLQLTNIYKLSQSNTGVFVFKVSNIVSFIDFIDFGRYMQFDTLPQHTVSSVSYSRGSLTVKVDYTQDLEGRPANLTLDFQSFVFANAKPISVPFSMVSSTSPLVILEYPSRDTIALLSNLLFGTAIVSLIIFVVASQFHKMIGLQTLHTFQFAYFLPLVITDTSVVLGCFKNLSYSTGFGKQLFYNSQQAQLFGFPFVQFQAAKQFVENMAGDGIYLWVIIVLLVSSSLFVWAVQDKRQISLFKRCKSVMHHLYHKGVFPVSMSMLSILILVTFLNNLQVLEWQSEFKNVLTTSQYNIISSKINTVLILVISTPILLIATLEIIISLSCLYSNPYKMENKKGLIKMLLLNQDNIRAIPSYIGFYLSYIFFTFILTIYLTFQQASYSIFVVTAFITVYSLIITLVFPYDERIHNYHIILIQATEIVICAGLSIKQYFLLNHQAIALNYQLIWAWIIAAMLIIVNLMAMMRICRIIIFKHEEMDQVRIKNMKQLAKNEYVSESKYGYSKIFQNSIIKKDKTSYEEKQKQMKQKYRHDKQNKQQQQLTLEQYMNNIMNKTFKQNLIRK